MGTKISEERKQEIVDAVIEQFKEDAEVGDYTVIDGLLMLVDPKLLVNSLPEEKWKLFPEINPK